MILDDFSGTWQGESVVPGFKRVNGVDKVVKFYLRIDYNLNTFKGIFIADPEESEKVEHANLVGEIFDNQELKFEIRYSKFYFYTDQLEQNLTSLDDDRVVTKITFTGRLTDNKIMLGTWEYDQTMFEYEGQVRKTMPYNGNWWAKKMN